MNKIIVTLIVLSSLLNAPSALCQNSYKIPAEDWSLNIDLGDFKVNKKYLSGDKTAFQLSATHKKGFINLSIFIEKAPFEGDKLACRDFYWGKAKESPLPKENIQLYEAGDLALVEHDMREFQGRRIDFHNLNAYLSNKGYWVDVHVSKIGYADKDKEAFEKIWKSIAIKPDN